MQKTVFVLLFGMLLQSCYTISPNQVRLDQLRQEDYNKNYGSDVVLLDGGNLYDVRLMPQCWFKKMNLTGKISFKLDNNPGNVCYMEASYLASKSTSNTSTIFRTAELTPNKKGVYHANFNTSFFTGGKIGRGRNTLVIRLYSKKDEVNTLRAHQAQRSADNNKLEEIKKTADQNVAAAEAAVKQAEAEAAKAKTDAELSQKEFSLANADAGDAKKKADAAAVKKKVQTSAAAKKKPAVDATTKKTTTSAVVTNKTVNVAAHPSKETDTVTVVKTKPGNAIANASKAPVDSSVVLRKAADDAKKKADVAIALAKSKADYANVAYKKAQDADSILTAKTDTFADAKKQRSAIEEQAKKNYSEAKKVVDADDQAIDADKIAVKNLGGKDPDPIADGSAIILSSSFIHLTLDE